VVVVVVVVVVVLVVVVVVAVVVMVVLVVVVVAAVLVMVLLVMVLVVVVVVVMVVVVVLIDSNTQVVTDPQLVSWLQGQRKIFDAGACYDPRPTHAITATTATTSTNCSVAQVRWWRCVLRSCRVSMVTVASSGCTPASLGMHTASDQHATRQQVGASNGMLDVCFELFPGRTLLSCWASAEDGARISSNRTRGM
jgi:ABC-type transport system involved in cytochrome bd biosynthesis fused ATPase/permease subunit